jgi:ABC-type branched-subunit amino acid transport system ATPase component
VVVINQGEKIADAPPEQIVENPNVIAAYLGTKRR